MRMKPSKSLDTSEPETSMANERSGDDSTPPPPAVVVLEDRSIDPRLVVYHDPKSLVAEQYRQFRTNLQAMLHGRGTRALVFSSALKGDGKSVSVANVAIALAELPGTRVCIIDTDFRAPRIAELFGLEDGPGLTELLLDEAALETTLLETKVRDLYAIRAGKEPRNPSELLGSGRIKDLLAALKPEFTHILCDSPPVNPYTDAAVLGAQLDGVVLVVRIGRTPREQVERARHGLQRAGANVIGVFLTDVPPADKREMSYHRRLQE
jgi:capsular exopolysaccharide synthesis family protein